MSKTVVFLNRTKYKHGGVKTSKDFHKMMKSAREYARNNKIWEAIVELFRWKPHATVDYIAEKLGVSIDAVMEVISEREKKGDCKTEKI